MEVPEEVKMTALLTRRFIRDELYPIENEVDQNDGLTDEQLERLQSRVKELGLWSLAGSPDQGGGGFKSHAMSVIMEERGKTSIYLAQFAGIWSGENEMAFGLTEPDGGSDTRALKTRAVRDGDNYVINGTKTFITHGMDAKRISVVCRTDTEQGTESIIQIMVPPDAPGVTARAQGMLGMHGGKHAELSFVDVVVPAANVTSGEGSGYQGALRGLVGGRLTIAASSVGTAVRALTMSIDYAKTRVAYGGPIATHQGVSFKLADMAVDIATCRSLTRQVAWMQDQGKDVRAEASMAKLFASEMVGRVVDNALQIHGGAGYTTDLPLERMYRDVRLWRIGEGTSEIQRYVISRALLNHYINIEDAF
jgi:acyl-CoA dehydrogenase